MNFKRVEKPKTQKEQIDLMWDFLFNFLMHKVELNTRLLWILLGGLIIAALIERLV